MANRLFKDNAKTLEGGVVKLFGKLVTTTSGTVDTTNTAAKGFAITKTAAETGRYTLTLEDNYTSLLGASVIIEGAADAAYTSAKGNVAFLRNVAVTTGTLDVQFCDADGSAADAELENGAKVYFELTLKNTDAY